MDGWMDGWIFFNKRKRKPVAVGVVVMQNQSKVEKTWAHSVSSAARSKEKSCLTLDTYMQDKYGS